MNTPGDVAKYIIQVTADQTANGKALFVTGGNAVDIEEGLNRTEPQWLGEKNSRELNEGQVILGLVSFANLTSTLSFGAKKIDSSRPMIQICLVVLGIASACA